MTCKSFTEVCRKFSRKANMPYIESENRKAKMAFFLEYETGEIKCMIRSYRKLSYHPHTSISPSMAAKHGTILATLQPKIHVGDVFFRDELADDVYYGELAVEAAYREMGM